jgi:hypothetical protein
MSGDSGILAKRDNNNITSIYGTPKELSKATQNKRRGMLISGVMFLHDNARLYTAACTKTKIKHFNSFTDSP